MKKSIPSYLGSTLLAASSLLLVAQSSEAISLIGNFNPANVTINDTRSNTIGAQGDFGSTDGSGGLKAVSFTLPTGTNYTLNSISLRLLSYNTGATSSGGTDNSTPPNPVTLGGDQALIRIYKDTAKTSTDPLGIGVNGGSGGGVVPILESVLFTNPTSNLTDTASALKGITPADPAGTFTFTPTTTFTFSADTKYWLAVYSAAPKDRTFRWTANSSNITPTGVATSGVYVTRFNNTATFNSNSQTGSFNIEATAVPFDFDPSLGLLGVGSLWLGRKYLKKIANKAKDNK